MLNNSIKRIWLVCLCLASLNLVGCFHVPDKDWLPNKNKVETWDIWENNEMKNALNSFINGIDIVSQERNEIKNKEDEELEEAQIDTGEMVDNETEY